MAEKKTRKLPSNYMDAVFCPNPAIPFTVGDDGLVTLALEHRGFFPKIAQVFFHKPRVSQVHMDAYGSAVWRCLDGKNTVFDVVERMKESFPQEQEDMLKRVVTFLGTLQNNKFILLADTLPK
jgi:hypothetical protein